MVHIDLLDLMVFLTFLIFGVLIVYLGNRYLYLEERLNELRGTVSLHRTMIDGILEYLKKNKNIVLSDETRVEQQEKNNGL